MDDGRIRTALCKANMGRPFADRSVQQLVQAKLTNVKSFDMGYRSSPEGLLEMGAVAHVIVGQTSTGRVIAIWGIDIWT